MATLYRKYRPTSFDEVVGQEHIVTTLKNALASGRLGHAYLFAGPRGTGKTTIARLLTKELGTKESDVIEIDAASNRGIDEVRELREKVRVVPGYSEKKVFIIDEVHMLTKEAFNALLKTLEEPPEHVVFILATTEPERILDTIISRTQRFDFRKLTNSEIADQLMNVAKQEEVELDEVAAQMIATHSEGAMRDALSHLEQMVQFEPGERITAQSVQQILGLPEFDSIQEVVQEMVSNHPAKALELVADLSSKGVDFMILLGNMVEYVRMMLLVQTQGTANGASAQLTDEQKKQLSAHAEETDKSWSIQCIGYLFQAREEMRVTPHPSLPLELVIAKMTNGSSQEKTPVEPRAEATAQAEKPANNTPETTESAPEESAVVEGKKEAEEVVSDEKPEKEPKNEDEGAEKEASEMVNVEPISSNLVIDDIVKKWGETLYRMKKKNFAIGGFLRGGKPVDIKDDKLVIVCQYGFHKEKIEDRANKHQIEEVLEQLFGRKMGIEVVLESELTEQQKEAVQKQTEQAGSEFEKNALEMFEGKVVSE